MNALILRVINVRTILMNKNASLVLVVIRVTSDVVAALDDGDAEATGLRKTASTDRTRIASSDNDHVVAVGRKTSGKPVCDTHSCPLDKLAFQT